MPWSTDTATTVGGLIFAGCAGPEVRWARPPVDHVFVRTTESKTAAAARIEAGHAVRARAELLGRLRSCFARTQTWQHAGRYLSALASEIPERNGWTIAQHAGDRTPDRTQRLLNRAAWDTRGVMSPVRRFVAASLDAVACRRRRSGLVVAGVGRDRLNGRPRQTLDFQTPSEALAKVLQ